MTKASKASTLGSAAASFAEILGSWDEGRLANLLAQRPDLGRPAPASLGELIRRAGSSSSVQQARWHLDRGAQQVLDAACLLPAPLSVAGLERLLGGPGQAGGLDEVLARLEGSALVLRWGDALVLAPGVSELRNPARLGPPARDALASQQASMLSSIARRLGLRPGANRGASLEAVARALADPARIEAVMSAAPPEAARLACLAATDGPGVSVQIGLFGLSDRTPAGWLQNHGLLAPMSWDLLVMPREVALILRGGRPFPDLELHSPEVVPIEVDQGAVDRGAAEAALRLVADVRTILDHWGQAEPAVLKDGGIGVRELRRAAKAIERSELETAQIIEVAAAAGLVASAPAGGQVLPLPAYDRWLSAGVPERWAGLVHGWLACRLHPSLSGALDDRSKPVPALLLRAEPHARQRREMVLGVLATRVPPGFTGKPGCLDRAAHWLGPDLWAGGPASPATLRRWVLGEAALVGMVLEGALSSFGRSVLRDWARRPPGAGAVTPVDTAAGEGKALFREAVEVLAQWAPALSSEFVVQADLTAVAPGELTSLVRSELGLLADVESKGAATVYRFSEASLRRGFDAGRSVPEIMAFLEAHATRGVPQALAYLVGDIGRRFGGLRVGSASCYLRCEDSSLLSEILASRRSARLGLRQVAPTVLVAGSDATTVLVALRAGGYLPALEDAAGELQVIDVAPRRAVVPPGHAWRGAAPDPCTLAARLRKGAGTPGCAPGRVPGGAPVVAPAPGGPPAPLGVPAPEGPPALRLPPGVSHALADSIAEMMEGLFATQEGRGVGDALDRPVDIARDPSSCVELLGQAFENDWMVRVGYTARSGRSEQLSATVAAVERHQVVVECVPRWNERTVAFDQIEWVRVMTEAEEEGQL